MERVRRIARHLVLGLDIRDYDEASSYLEVAWSDNDGDDPTAACEHALDALNRDELPGKWVLVTWS